MKRQLQEGYLDAMGIRRWVARQSAAAAPVLEPGASDGAGPAAGEVPVRELDWPELQRRVENCTRCALHESRTRTVFGTGNREAEWLVIGEAPGRDEDLAGEPFVGRAGKLLTEMLFALGYRRRDVYIANILKCRPPNNRDPSVEEVACCRDYLERQIKLLRPVLLLAVGRIAAQNLLQTDLRVGRLRGRVHYYGEQRIPLVVTYHPAYLLRSPHEKRKVWADLQLARSAYRERLAGASGENEQSESKVDAL